MAGGWGSDWDDEDPETFRRTQLASDNAVRLFVRVTEIVQANIAAPEAFEFTPKLLCELHFLAMDGLIDTAGLFRVRDVEITGQGKAKPHEPPAWPEVPKLVEDLCSDVMAGGREAVSHAAFVMWRLGWIHPFDDGNGRTARAAAYLVLSIALGNELSGNPSMLELLSEKKHLYLRYLDSADVAWGKTGEVDVSELAYLLRELLTEQLTSDSAKRPLRR